MKTQTRNPRGCAGNQRLSSTRQRKQQHLLDVKVRSRKATQQRMNWVVSALCKVILLAALIGGVCYGVREGVRRLLWENPDYTLSQVTVTSDGSLTRDQILSTADIREGRNIFTVNLSKARERLAALPQVEHIEIQRILPNKISVSIAERKPIAWLTAKGDEDPSASAHAFLIDRAGVLLKPKLELPEYLHLPVIFGVPTDNLQSGQTLDDYQIRAAIDLIRLSTSGQIQTRFQVRGVDLSKGYCMVVTDQTRAQIKFGFDRIDWQLDRLGMVLDRVDESKKELQTVNLMVQRNVPVTFVDESAEEDPMDGAASGQAAATPAASAKPGATPAKGAQKTSPQVKHAQPVSPSVKRAKPVSTKSKKKNHSASKTGAAG